MIDFLLISGYLINATLDLTNSYYTALTIGQTLLVAVVFMKINFFLRIYDGFSFLVSMMAGVFSDIQYFLLFWLIFLAQFSLIFTILF
jgi:hypothetical protein